jgi:hypothetical protein
MPATAPGRHDGPPGESLECPIVLLPGAPGGLGCARFRNARRAELCRQQLHRRRITIGLVTKDHPLTLQPGTATAPRPGGGSTGIALRSTDGLLFNGAGDGRNGTSFCKPFGVGDTVGCCLLYELQRVFFTLNGKRIGESGASDCRGAATDSCAGTAQPLPSHSALYPAVSVHSLGDRVCGVFSGPFQFPLAQEIARIRADNWLALGGIKALPSVASSLVQDYLLREGYERALTALQGSLHGPAEGDRSDRRHEQGWWSQHWSASPLSKRSPLGSGSGIDIDALDAHLWPGEASPKPSVTPEHRAPSVHAVAASSESRLLRPSPALAGGWTDDSPPELRLDGDVQPRRRSINVFTPGVSVLEVQDLLVSDPETSQSRSRSGTASSRETEAIQAVGVLSSLDHSPPESPPPSRPTQLPPPPSSSRQQPPREESHSRPRSFLRRFTSRTTQDRLRMWAGLSESVRLALERVEPRATSPLPTRSELSDEEQARLDVLFGLANQEDDSEPEQQPLSRHHSFVSATDEEGTDDEDEDGNGYETSVSDDVPFLGSPLPSRDDAAEVGDSDESSHEPLPVISLSSSSSSSGQGTRPLARPFVVPGVHSSAQFHGPGEFTIPSLSRLPCKPSDKTIDDYDMRPGVPVSAVGATVAAIRSPTLAAQAEPSVAPLSLGPSASEAPSAVLTRSEAQALESCLMSLADGFEESVETRGAPLPLTPLLGPSSHSPRTLVIPITPSALLTFADVVTVSKSTLSLRQALRSLIVARRFDDALRLLLWRLPAAFSQALARGAHHSIRSEGRDRQSYGAWRALIRLHCCRALFAEQEGKHEMALKILKRDISPLVAVSRSSPPQRALAALSHASSEGRWVSETMQGVYTGVVDSPSLLSPQGLRELASDCNWVIESFFLVFRTRRRVAESVLRQWRAQPPKPSSPPPRARTTPSRAHQLREFTVGLFGPLTAIGQLLSGSSSSRVAPLRDAEPETDEALEHLEQVTEMVSERLQARSESAAAVAIRAGSVVTSPIVSTRGSLHAESSPKAPLLIGRARPIDAFSPSLRPVNFLPRPSEGQLSSADSDMDSFELDAPLTSSAPSSDWSPAEVSMMLQLLREPVSFSGPFPRTSLEHCVRSVVVAHDLIWLGRRATGPRYHLPMQDDMELLRRDLKLVEAPPPHPPVVRASKRSRAEGDVSG